MPKSLGHYLTKEVQILHLFTEYQCSAASISTGYSQGCRWINKRGTRILVNYHVAAVFKVSKYQKPVY